MIKRVSSAYGKAFIWFMALAVAVLIEAFLWVQVCCLDSSDKRAADVQEHIQQVPEVVFRGLSYLASAVLDYLILA